MLVDRSPQVVQLAADADEHLIQMPFVARPGPAPLERVGERTPEAQAPGADALVADHDAALGQDRLNLTQAQAEAVVEPDSVADDLGRKAEAVVGTELARSSCPATCHTASAMAMPDKPRSTIGKPLISHLGQEGFGLRLDRLGEQAART